MIRPEIWQLLGKLKEAAFWFALILFFGLLSYSFRAAHPIAAIVPLFLGFLALLGLLLALWRMRFGPSGDVQGIVRVDERRIEYLAPYQGGIVDLDKLQRIEVQGNESAKRWVLYHDDGPPISISTDVKGADELLDLFSGFAGLSLTRIAQALSQGAITDGVLWERPPRYIH